MRHNLQICVLLSLLVSLILILIGFFVPISTPPIWQRFLFIGIGLSCFILINYFGCEKSARGLSRFGLSGGLALLMLQYWTHGQPPIPPLNHPLSTYLRDALLLFFLVFLAAEHKAMEHFSIRRPNHIHFITGFLSFIFLWEKDLARLFALFLYLIYMMFITNGRISAIWVVLLIACPIFSLVSKQIHRPLCPMCESLLLSKYPCIGSDEFNYMFGLISLGHGGWMGFKTGYWVSNVSLIEGNPDFVFSWIGEHLGFAGTSVFLLAYLVLVFFCIKISFNTKNPSSTYLSLGMTFYLCFSVLAHTGWAVYLSPYKGLGLPLMVHGPPLVSFLMALGVVTSCGAEKEIHRELRGFVFNRRRARAIVVAMIISFCLLFVRLFQYQVLDREKHLRAYIHLLPMLPQEDGTYE